MSGGDSKLKDWKDLLPEMRREITHGFRTMLGEKGRDKISFSIFGVSYTCAFKQEGEATEAVIRILDGNAEVLFCRTTVPEKLLLLTPFGRRIVPQSRKLRKIRDHMQSVGVYDEVAEVEPQDIVGEVIAASYADDDKVVIKLLGGAYFTFNFCPKGFPRFASPSITGEALEMRGPWRRSLGAKILGVTSYGESFGSEHEHRITLTTEAGVLEIAGRTDISTLDRVGRPITRDQLFMSCYYTVPPDAVKCGLDAAEDKLAKSADAVQMDGGDESE